MNCCKSAKTPCALPLCPVRKEPAFGKRRLSPAVKGRDQREQAYFDAHPRCEWPGCREPSTEVHHIGGRGLGGHSRRTAELIALCRTHHEAVHQHRAAVVAP